MGSWGKRVTFTTREGEIGVGWGGEVGRLARGIVIGLNVEILRRLSGGSG
jgi:hypothetical protein